MVSDKMDVVVTYYRRPHLFHQVVEGLINNREFIQRVIVVNDEPWTFTNEPRWIRSSCPPVVLLDHEHDGYGVVRSLNQGVAEATTDFVVNVSDDTVLAPQAIENMLPALAPKRLVYGRLDGVPLHKAVEAGAPHRICTAAFYIFDREANNKIGGLDPYFAGTYGWEEFDYCLRWMLEYGIENVVSGPGRAKHLGPMSVGSQRGSTKDRNYRRFQQTLAKVLAKYPNLKLKEQPHDAP
jgi:GT2 family glycosyltransferase